MASLNPLPTLSHSTFSSSFFPLFKSPHLNNNKAPKVGKPSQYHASRIFYSSSCKAKHNNGDNNNNNNYNNNNKVDRRNILVGLGGLYGVAKTLTNEPLVSLAAPISPPNLTQCGPPDLPSGAKPVNCCPPVSSKIIDFTFPLNQKVKVRPAAHLADATYIRNYKEALRRMKALDPTDPRSFTQQSNIHCAYCDGAYHQVGFPDLDLQIHNSWLFFPFHRWYLYFYERILASLIKDLDPNFAIPFWNWDSPKGMPIPSMFVDPKSTLYDSLRNKNHQPPKLVDLDFNGTEDNLPDQQTIDANLKTMYRQMVSNSKTATLFFGSAYRAGDESDPGAGVVENIPHGPVHIWTGDNTQPNGEDMGNFYSAARDPIFFSHHSNVDRMWSIWKTLGGKRNEFNDVDWLESGFLFYDENKNLVRVKVKDCIDTKKLGYVYQEVEIPWLNTKPTPRRVRVKNAIKKGLHLGGVAHAAEEGAKFPLVLDSSVRVLVKRPKKGRSKREKEEEEEVLVVEGISFERDMAVKFDVYVNDEDDEVESGPTKTEFAGSFVSVPHKHKHKKGKMKTQWRVGITELLEELDAEDDEHVAVTLVPKIGKGQVTIGGINIQLLN
ncbi:polyphenol oxidase, chloroplastic [Arachis duranensis]|uniref:Polyphenol oxidase, chloroplastic n=1 Tax=Arachis duranensis TaxID=130453 RepID=A0A6P4C4R2_ARADU|nr:polyphenol oxidase, chloroplastic [Arachis duranensis]